MPRRMNPNSLKNLRSTNTMSGEEHLRMSSKGGRNAKEARRILKSFREIDAETTSYEEREEMLNVVKLKAKKGNLRAFEIYRDTVGEKPGNKIEFAEDKDDGFLEALKGTASEDWSGEENGDIKI